MSVKKKIGSMPWLLVEGEREKEEREERDYRISKCVGWGGTKFKIRYMEG